MATATRAKFLRWIGHDPVITQAASARGTFTPYFCHSILDSVGGSGDGDTDPECASERADFVKGYSHDLPSQSKAYVARLFPFTKWILNYNLTWLTGDLIAGFTVGLVVVPQSMVRSSFSRRNRPPSLLLTLYARIRLFLCTVLRQDCDVACAIRSVLVVRRRAHLCKCLAFEVWTSWPFLATDR